MLAQDARLDTARRRARYGSTPVAVRLDARLDTYGSMPGSTSILDPRRNRAWSQARCPRRRLDVNPRCRLDAPRSGLDSSMPGLRILVGGGRWGGEGARVCRSACVCRESDARERERVRICCETSVKACVKTRESARICRESGECVCVKRAKLRETSAKLARNSAN